MKCLNRGVIACFMTLTACCGLQTEEEKVNTPAWENFLKYKGLEPGVPNFAHAGYNGRAEEIPAVTRETHTYFDVTQFGAVPNDGKSDRQAVIDAIQAAEAHAGNAVVFFPKGEFVLRSKEEWLAPPIEITRSNVVVQGSGMYKGGTELIAESAGPYLISIQCKDPLSAGYRKQKLTSVTNAPKRGEQRFQVESVEPLAVGDYVSISGILPLDDEEKVTAFYYPHTMMKEYAESSGAPWYRRQIIERHQIASIDEATKTVTFVSPIQFNFTLTENPAIVVDSKDGKQRYLTDVGVENLAFVSNYHDLFAHYRNYNGDGYNFLTMIGTRNSWGRHLRMRNTSDPLRPVDGMFNTFYDIQIEGNAGHMAISGYTSYGNLYAYIRELTDSHHGLGGTDNHTNGVYLRCVQTANLEAHCRYPHATLFDVNQGMFNRIREGGATHTPHHGPDLVYWNWCSSNAFFGSGNRMFPTDNHAGFIDFWPEGNQYGYILPPYVVGLHGVPVTIRDEETDLRLNESQGTKVYPESLFEAQLQETFGEVPAWITSRSASFEAISRHSNIQIATPFMDSTFSLGKEIEVVADFPEAFDTRYIQKVELYAQDFAVDFDAAKSRLVTSIDAKDDEFEAFQSHPTLIYPCSSAGVESLFLVLTNTLGEQMISDPVVIHIDSDKNEFLPVAKACLGKIGASSRASYSRADAQSRKESTLAAIQRKFVQLIRETEMPLYDAAFAADAHLVPLLLDDDLSTVYLNQHTLILDLGSVKDVKGVQLCFPDKQSSQLMGLEISTSNQAEALRSAHNNDEIWNPVRRIGRTLIPHDYSWDSRDKLNIFIPVTQTRYIKLWQRSGAITLSEVKVLAK